MKKILITGAYGFVGTNLASYLKDKYLLWGLDIREGIPGLYSRYFSWDHLKDIPFDEIDTIIHLAGKAHDVKGKIDDQVYFDINTGLTQKIFDQFISSKADKIIYFSSVKAVADIVEGSLVEDVTAHPVGPYGKSKKKAEEYILSKDWLDKKVYLFRPCMIHGPGNKGNLNLLYSFINKGIPYPLGLFDNKRSFTSIFNLCYIIDSTISNNIKSGVYNIADDEPISTNYLIELISRALGQKEKIWNTPSSLIKIVAKIGDLCPFLPFNSFRLNKLTENYVVDNSKIKRALSVDFLPMPSSEGIIKTIQSFKVD